MKKIMIPMMLVAALVLTACGAGKSSVETANQNSETVSQNSDAANQHNDTAGQNGQARHDKGFQIVDRPEGKLPTVILYDQDGIKLTLSEPDPALLKAVESQKEMTFDRAGMLTLENQTKMTVGVAYAELYVNRIQTDENILELIAEAGKKEMLVLDLTPYKNRLFHDQTSLLENGEIHSISFQCSMVDIDAGWVPFDDFDFYIPIGDEAKQQAFLDKLTSKENLCFENDALAIYFLERYYPEDYKADSESIQKYYEFIAKNKTDQYLTFYETEDTSINGKTIGRSIGPGGGISSGNYLIDYTILGKIDRYGAPIMQYDEIKYVFYYGLSDSFGGEDTKKSEFELTFKPADFGLETTSAPDEVQYR